MFSKFLSICLLYHDYDVSREHDPLNNLNCELSSVCLTPSHCYVVDRNDDDADDDEEEGKFVQEWKASVFNLSSCGQSNITSVP